jgi:hypothetical protein
MTRLALTSILMGTAMVAARLPGVLAPARYRAFVRAFPRSVWWGRILIGIAAVWAGIVMYGAARATAAEAVQTSGPGSLWALAPPAVVIGVPVAYWLVIQFGASYLAVRGAAAVLLLLCKVILDVADRSDNPWRLVVTTLVYVWVVAAIWMASAPHHIRDVIQWATATDNRCRAWCGVGVVLGAVMIVLGVTVY